MTEQQSTPSRGVVLMRVTLAADVLAILFALIGRVNTVERPGFISDSNGLGLGGTVLSVVIVALGLVVGRMALRENQGWRYSLSLAGILVLVMPVLLVIWR